MPRGGLEYQHLNGMVEVMTHLRQRTQPWHFSALWRTQNNYFYKVGRGGALRLYRTGVGLGFAWADLTMRDMRGGGTLMLVKTAAQPWVGNFAWALCVVCLFMVSYNWVEYGGSAFLRRDLPYLLLCGAGVFLTWLVGRETPKLLDFLQADLGWRPIQR